MNCRYQIQIVWAVKSEIQLAWEDAPTMKTDIGFQDITTDDNELGKFDLEVRYVIPRLRLMKKGSDDKQEAFAPIIKWLKSRGWTILPDTIYSDMNIIPLGCDE